MNLSNQNSQMSFFSLFNFYNDQANYLSSSRRKTRKIVTCSDCGAKLGKKKNQHKYHCTYRPIYCSFCYSHFTKAYYNDIHKNACLQRKKKEIEEMVSLFEDFVNKNTGKIIVNYLIDKDNQDAVGYKI